MKTKLVYLFIVASLLFSCKKELSFENSTAGNGGTGGGGTNTACKDCIYVPSCDGSWYDYDLEGFGGTQSVTDTTKYIKDTVISGVTFRKIYYPVADNYVYISCTNGETRFITYDATSLGGATTDIINYVVLKANGAINTTWVDNITLTSGLTYVYKSTLKEKNISRTVNGKTFSDVMHVVTDVGTNVPGIGFTVLTTSDYFYAKGVGMIEFTATDPTSGMVLSSQKIKSYFVP